MGLRKTALATAVPATWETGAFVSDACQRTRHVSSFLSTIYLLSAVPSYLSYNTRCIEIIETESIAFYSVLVMLVGSLEWKFTVSDEFQIATMRTLEISPAV